EHGVEPGAADVAGMGPRPGVDEVGPAGAEVVDDVDLVALGQQPIDDVGADEAGASGDEHSHADLRVRNHSMVSRSPSSVSTRRPQPGRVGARVMSGWRPFGSSSGRGPNTISLAEPVTRTMRLASSSRVISCGLPMFTGSL